MKFLYNNTIFTLVLVFTLGIASCKKNQQSTHSSKDQIVASEWFNPIDDNKNLWLGEQDLFNHLYFRTEMIAPDITQWIADNSLILVYGKLKGYKENIWNDEKVGLLPAALYLGDNANSVDNWNYKIEAGKIIITMQNSRYLYPNKTITDNHSFRYLVIPRSTMVVTGYKPTAATPLSRYTESEIRNLSYEELCSIGGLVK